MTGVFLPMLASSPIILIAAAVFAESVGSGAWTLRWFTAFVAATVRRNLPLGAALRAYAEELPVWWLPRKRTMVFEIGDALDDGISFADALDAYPAVFPAHYRALVRTGERGGNLGRVLQRLTEIAEIDESAAQRAAANLWYPALIAAKALRLAAAASGNRHFDAMVAAAAARVAEGARLSDALKAADPRGELPPGLVWYVEVGEASGALPRALGRAAESAAARSQSALAQLVSLVFPASIVLVGLIVGTLGYALFATLVALMESLL